MKRRTRHCSGKTQRRRSMSSESTVPAPGQVLQVRCSRSGGETLGHPPLIEFVVIPIVNKAEDVEEFVKG